MKAEVKDQWVKDLRSGEFIQGEHVLDRIRDGQREFCCLGVLCQQAVKAGVIPAPELHGKEYAYLDTDYDGSGRASGEAFNQTCSLPRKVAEWAGVKDENGDVRDDVIIRPHEDGVNQLSGIGANDGIGSKCFTFAEIADLIEQNVPGE